MRTQKFPVVCLLTALALGTVFPLTVKARPVGGTFQVTGRLKLDKLGIQDANPRVTIRLYSPKEANKPVLIAYADGNGVFTFSDIMEGSYLFEAYAENQMVYQKAIQVGPNTKLDDRFLFLVARAAGSKGREGELVQTYIKLKERNKTVLSGFQENLSVSIGNINRITRKVTITILETKGGQLVRKEVKKIGDDIFLEFKYNGSVYYLEGYTKTGFTSYLYFQIFRKTS
jgi:hypothetical protein